MTTNTANNRLAAAGLFTQKGEIKARYSSILYALAAGVTRFHCCRWRRNGRRHQLQDDSEKIRRVFNALRLSWTEGNDAPRGGREGDYIEITAAARRALAPVTAEFKVWLDSKR